MPLTIPVAHIGKAVPVQDYSQPRYVCDSGQAGYVISVQSACENSNIVRQPHMLSHKYKIGTPGIKLGRWVMLILPPSLIVFATTLTGTGV